ncbi:MAG: hypothetical protein ACAI35_18480, partial [Candidatus Methylacidiphilales bacterium]
MSLRTAPRHCHCRCQHRRYRSESGRTTFIHVVMEARRGMRTHGFAICLLGLHALMLLCFWSPYLLYRPWLPYVSVEQETFWMVCVCCFLIAIPCASYFSFGNEARNGSVELLAMTRVWQPGIVLGKWLARVAEAALIACTLMPYAVLHYFRGGVNPLFELVLLGILLLGSAHLCSFCMLLSVLKGPHGWIQRILMCALNVPIGLWVGFCVFAIMESPLTMIGVTIVMLPIVTLITIAILPP